MAKKEKHKTAQKYFHILKKEKRKKNEDRMAVQFTISLTTF